MYVAENALDLPPHWLHAQKVKTIQYSALRLSSYLIISLGLFMLMSLFPFFFFAEPGGIAQCSNITFDLKIFKRVPINPEMQIIGPEDCCGALRSECSFDGVKFKRIIMVLGNEN